MSDKKHIDRIFQEKLKDFEANPDKAVWHKIKEQIKHEKEDRKVIPIWWKLAGIAATFLLLFTVGNLIFNDSNSSQTPTTVNTEEKENFKNDANDSNTRSDALENNNISDKNNSSVVDNTNEETIDASKNTDDVSTSSEIIQQEDSNINNRLVKTDKSSNRNDLVNSKSKNQSQTSVESTDYLAKNITQKEDNNLIENPLKKVAKEVLAENTKTNSELVKNDKIVNEKEDQLVVIEQKEEKIPLTEDVIANNENIYEEEKETINRWQINPNVAPVYFNLLGDGSPIHEQLNSNDKEGEINMSYGINVSYAVNDKFTVKSGLNRVNLGYNTNDVIVYNNAGFSASVNTDLFKNINLKSNIQNLSIVSGELSGSEGPSAIPNESVALLNQEMTFYEIPLEVKYKVSDKKLNFSVIGGFSTFILSGNEVSYELKGENTVLGEATNLNNTSFSANIGFGLNYDISKSINLNLDPMFKYQINTFNNTTGNFKPYIIGVYSGINVKF